MWKVALFAVAVLLGTVQGRTLGVASWDRLLAEVMQGSNTGICGPLCYIEEEKKVLEQGEDFVKGCTVYGCRSSGVHVAIIECPENVECPEDSNTIIYPGQCCMTCEGPRDEVGIFTEWEEWTPCSKSCGGGRKARRRECKIDVTAGLVECTGSILETDDCNIQGCPVPCEWEYGDFEQCNATCGDGVHQRFPTITQHPQNGGKPCPPHVNNGEPQEAPCNLHPCAIPCEWEYGEYGECSATCGGGTKTRYPNILKPAEHGGRCPAHVVIREPDTADCNSDPCPVPCEWEYEEYGECSATCGGGTKTRYPNILKPAEHGGRCPAHVVIREPDTTDCNSDPCPVPCEWEYEEYGECSATCGGGTKTRYPNILKPAEHGGRCPAHVVIREPDTTDCNSDPCPVHCEWEYGEYGECSATCGGGTKTRYPNILKPAEHGGRCPAHVVIREPDTTDCTSDPCPVPCEWEYGKFEACTKTCGGGTRSRFPIIINPAQHGGHCPRHVLDGIPETQPCNEQPCPIPCEWRYGEYGVCSVTCGGGTKVRYPEIIVPAQHGGDCPVHVLKTEPDTDSCNEHPCPVPCEWEWGEYGDCSATCDGGTQSRVAIIITPAQHGGYCLPEVGRPDTRACNTQDCPPACPNPDDNNCLINGVYKCIYDPDRDCVEQDDNCEFAYNPDQKDMEHDGVGDVCDNCRFLANTDQINTDGDETGNACDGDDDNDGVVDQKDNCGLKPNPTQTDRDGDRIGDECDNCPFRSNNNQADFDEDGVGNACDNCRFYPNPEQGAGDRQTYGFLCTTRPKGMDIQDYEGDEYYDDEMNLNKKGMAAEIMEKLLKMYYNE